VVGVHFSGGSVLLRRILSSYLRFLLIHRSSFESILDSRLSDFGSEVTLLEYGYCSRSGLLIPASPFQVAHISIHLSHVSFEMRLGRVFDIKQLFLVHFKINIYQI
jgi:hypothetical protein